MTDLLLVGWVGWGPSLHPTHLLPSELKVGKAR